MRIRAATLRSWTTLVVLLGVLFLGAISESGTASVGRASAIAGGAGGATTAWRNCGTVQQSPVNGYVFTNRVQARDGISCRVARYIGRHFQSGGYSHRGLTCWYAPMGSGNPYWNWSCMKTTSGIGTPARKKVRGHLHVSPE
jgi:hypothetical protein